MLIRAAPFLGAAFFIGAPVAARDILLNPPIACDLASTCFVQNYMDHDPGPGAADFTCALQSYDGHDGTDFALPSETLMQTGVNVLAAAPGTVKGMRDGMEDVAQGTPDAPDVTDRECGNGLVIDHGGGWETQYCHLKRGSLAVETGRHVRLGEVLGQVGLSGQTEFPHVHLTVRHNGVAVDPFHPDETQMCGDHPTPLWQAAPAYQPGGVINAGFTTEIPEFAVIKAGLAVQATLPETAPALVFWAQMFGSRTGDALQITIIGPDGMVIDQSFTLEKPQARLFRATGKRRPDSGWRPGNYTGSATLLRDSVVIDQQTVALTVTP